MKFFQQQKNKKISGFTQTVDFDKAQNVLRLNSRAFPKFTAGFTLIETMIAVFILTVVISGLLSQISTGLFTARYAKNEITANYLIQEVGDYIRNDRDSIAFKQGPPTGGWNMFLAKYNTCFLLSAGQPVGCDIEPNNPVGASAVQACPSGTPAWGTFNCRILYYNESALKGFYTYTASGGVPSNFKRRIIMKANTYNVNPVTGQPDEIDIFIKVEWKNGNLVRSKSVYTSLLNWQQ